MVGRPLKGGGRLFSWTVRLSAKARDEVDTSTPGEAADFVNVALEARHEHRLAEGADPGRVRELEEARARLESELRERKAAANAQILKVAMERAAALRRNGHAETDPRRQQELEEIFRARVKARGNVDKNWLHRGREDVKAIGWEKASQIVESETGVRVDW